MELQIQSSGSVGLLPEDEDKYSNLASFSIEIFSVGWKLEIILQ
jgi:hypothetical protein